jgi:hypothetical protein
MDPEFIFRLLKSRAGTDISDLIPRWVLLSGNKGAIGWYLHCAMGAGWRGRDFPFFELKTQATQAGKSTQLPICNAVAARMLADSFNDSLWKRELERILLIQYSLYGASVFCDNVYLFESPASILLYAETLYLRAQNRLLMGKLLVPDHVGGISLRRKGNGAFGFFLSGKLVEELKLLSA